MDRIAQSDLSLGFGSSHALPHPPRIPIADDSITLQIDSSFRPSSNPMPPVPLQLLEQRFDVTGSCSRVVEEDDDVVGDYDEDDDDDQRQFILLGHSLKLKRCRGGNSYPMSSSSKRFVVDSGIEGRRAAVRAWGNQSIEEADPEIHEFMEKEKQRQFRGIELIASENFVCRAVMEALGSHLTNKYSEGMPGARYYMGNQYIDQIEILCQERALAAFGLHHEKWGVNVQPYSCTSANFAVFAGLLMPGERIMGLDSPSGGHMSHGYYTPGGKKVSGASIFFESFPYKVDPRTGYIDYDKLEEKALDYRPKILICGGSSYPRDWEFPRFRHIADKCGAVLMFDMAQISGLVAAKVCSFSFFILRCGLFFFGISH